MILIKPIKIQKGTVTGVRIEMPEKNGSMLIVLANKGYVMCGYLDMEVADIVGDNAARVSGVDSFEDVLGAEIKAVTSGAKKLGVVEGMTGEEALNLFI